MDAVVEEASCFEHSSISIKHDSSQSTILKSATKLSEMKSTIFIFNSGIESDYESDDEDYQDLTIKYLDLTYDN